MQFPIVAWNQLSPKNLGDNFITTVLRTQRLTVSGESQLSAGHIRISSIPEVITHSPPLVV